MRNPKDRFKRTTISLKEEEYEVLRFVAFKQKTSIAGVVRRLISEMVEDQEDIRDAMKALNETSGGLDWQTFKRKNLGI